MAYIDYYQVLGVDKKASQDDIKKAFRKLARKYHPHSNPNDATANDKFQAINEANEVLSDPEKERNMMNMVNTGNMPTSLKRRSGHSSKPGLRGIWSCRFWSFRCGIWYGRRRYVLVFFRRPGIFGQ